MDAQSDATRPGHDVDVLGKQTLFAQLLVEYFRVRCPTFSLSAGTSAGSEPRRNR